MTIARKENSVYIYNPILNIMSKFKVGQRVYLFNSLSLQVESDEIFAIIEQPEAVDGKEFDQNKDIASQLEAGVLQVVNKYQLGHHHGVLDESVMFASEEELRKYFRDFFAE